MLAALGAAALLAAASPQAEAGPPERAPTPSYVDGFCLRIAAGANEGAEYYHLLGAAGARPQSSAAGDALTPVDEPAPGQVFRFEPGAPDAPTAVIDARRGQCALVWPGSSLPPSALSELSDDRPKSGADGAPQRWRRVTAAIITRPRPPRWFIQVGAQEGQGVCADALTDLRRRDRQPVSMLRLAPCRPDAGEKVEAP